MPTHTVGFWHETVDFSRPNPPLIGTTDADVAIIGGGYTGLSTALELKRAEPGLRVALLESHLCGYGASGRNGGFAMALFGLTMELVKLRFGHEAVHEAQTFMDQAVENVGRLVREEQINCDYERTGLMTVATSPGGARRLQRETALANALGFHEIHYLDAAETRRRVNSATYLGARIEENCALLNPARFARGLKTLAEAAGATLYEETPVTLVQPPRRGQPIVVETPLGQVLAQKVVFATNAYARAFPQLASKQVPVGTYIVLTEPLSPEELASIGWQGREGIEDAPNLVHYYRLTADNRLLMGGGDVTFKRNADLPNDYEPRVFRELEEHLALTFPSLKTTRITHRWGGPVSVPVDMAPAFGSLGNERRVCYALGCVGHGVSLMSYAGNILRDLVLERQSAFTELFFVNRRTIPWPPEPVLFPAAHLIRGYMRLEDSVTRRAVRQNSAVV
ncbi:MAG TPA: oxidoreductase [Chloroflexi bacterium]|nr:oxidoreductase [Chloroflexota bacterium]